MITGKIDVRKINKEKLFVGAKGLYLDIVLIETPNSQYGDFMIKQEGAKEEDMPILGSAKYFKKREVNDSPEPDELPF